MWKKPLIGFLIPMIMLGLTIFVGCSPQVQEESAETTKKEDQNQLESEDLASGPSTVDFAWTSDSDCSLCHTTEVDSQSNVTCLASAHASETCMNCHEDDVTLEAAHEGATAQAASRAGLKATTVPEEVCTVCHDKAGIAQATAASVVLTDENGTVVNPHDLPGIPDHESLNCNSCHQMHVADANLNKKAQRACGSCHHTNVYECYTCHP